MGVKKHTNASLSAPLWSTKSMYSAYTFVVSVNTFNVNKLQLGCFGSERW